VSGMEIGLPTTLYLIVGCYFGLYSSGKGINLSEMDTDDR